MQASYRSQFAVLPEFIPFKDDRDSNERDEAAISSPPPSYDETRSPGNFSESRSFDRQQQRNHSNNGSQRRDSYRSPRHSPDRYESRRRSRSRSPRQNSRNERSYHRPERMPSERNNHGSVFDRMSSPPVQRKYREASCSRHSAGSNNSAGRQTHFRGTVNGNPTRYRDYENSSLDVDVRSRRSPFDVRHVLEPDLRSIQRPPIDDSASMRSLQERLASAENHCRGLQTTVRSYEREILKLQQIVDNLIEDFEILHRRTGAFG